MRPIKLALEGFTCYQKPVEVDFRDMDLFAITGATGAGKSSLVHGMTYALYGRVPGFGNEVKELISQSSEHLQVSFEFAANGARYVVVRRTSRRGAPHAQLFRIGEDGGAEGLTDRVRETNERVRALVGLDFEGFTRSVLLPQGQFHLFLAGEPAERRRVLAELLRLDIYEQIMRAANARAADQEREAAGLRRRLLEDFADATQEALDEKKSLLSDLESQAQELSALRAALQEAKDVSATLAAALAGLHGAQAELAQQEAALAAAQEIARRGDEQLHGLEAGLKDVEAQLAESAFQPELHQALRLALTPAREHDQALGETQRLGSQIDAQEQVLNDTRCAAQTAEETAAKAQDIWRETEASLQGMRRRHAAADLRRGLKPGEPCPVCDQPVMVAPAIEHVALDEAEKQERAARRAAETAAENAGRARQKAALAERDLATAQKQLAEAQTKASKWRGELTSCLGVEKPPAAAEVQAEWQAQEQARRQHVELEAERARLAGERARLAGEYEKARAELAGLEARVQAQRSQAERLEAEAGRARDSLLELARRPGWEDVAAAVEQGREPVALDGRAAEAEKQAASVQQEIGGLKTDIQRIQEGIKQAARLRQEEAELTGRARLARELAGLLRADRFQAYVEEAALRVLADDGSRHLADVSRGRYEFAVSGQEFQVVDHWNGDQLRSVRTLSGGETFLASLALALALAEHLPELGALSDRTALESLFLDEGFSSLDTETRDVVAGALEQLHLNGTRMVGIITHDRELAERMPNRITVSKSESGSSVSAE